MQNTLRFISCLMVLLLMVSVAAVNAQDTFDQQPLMQMLARVPDTAVSRSDIYFHDRRAIETAYPPAKMPANWAEFELITPDALENPLTALLVKPLAVWWQVWQNNNSSLMGRYFNTFGDMPAAVGFDFFTIDQELNYGAPPQQTLQVMGSFDLDAVRTAFSAQDFTQEDRTDVELWCGPDGCESGSQVDVRNRNPANPFGGDLGRKWPLLVEDGALTSSPDLTVIDDHIAVTGDNLPSLADAPEYRAAVEAVTADGPLLQAYVVGGEMLNTLAGSLALLMNSDLTPEQLEELKDRLLEDYEPLPAFELMLIADTVTDTEQAARAALVYSDKAAAEQAADMLPERIANYQSLRVNMPFADLLQELGVDNVYVQVVKTAAGKCVVLLTFAIPKATPEQILEFAPGNNQPAGVTAPGLIYNLLVQSAVMRDLGWLSTVPREALEAVNVPPVMTAALAAH